MAPPRIASIELPATDLAATKAFYSAAFAWDWTDYGPTYAASTTGGLEIGLTSGAKVGEPAAIGAEFSTGPLVLFQADDLEASRSNVVEHGGVIVTDTFAFPGGQRFHFQDPSGNVLGVYTADET